MRKKCKYAVIGRGLMGSAAARHLANMSEGVVLVGPVEPHDRKSHRGVFASHYDEGRITRTIDTDPVWAKLARASIARYREIEAASGVNFYGEVGNLMTGPSIASGNSYLPNILQAASAAGVTAEHLDGEALRERFSDFSFPGGTEGVFEAKGAGHISPRKLVAAQSQLAERAGAELIASAVKSVREINGGVVVETDQGDSLEAEVVLVATGGFTIQNGLLPRAAELSVYARTVVFFEVSEAEAERLAMMPSMINKAQEERDSTYMLPPIRYPDGRFYLKIGGDPVDIRVNGDQLEDWFRGDGNRGAIEHLKARMKSLVPDLEVISTSSAPCVTSFTSSGYPAIGWQVPGRIAVVTGGCGASAKSSDEIGRLGAELVFEGKISSSPHADAFEPVFGA
jgi:sarcosine oxidase